MVYVNCLFVWLARSQNSRRLPSQGFLFAEKLGWLVYSTLSTTWWLRRAMNPLLVPATTLLLRVPWETQNSPSVFIRLTIGLLSGQQFFANSSSISCTSQLAFCFCLAFGFLCWSCAIGSSVSPSYFVFSGFVFRFLPLIFSAEVDLGCARCFRCRSRFNIIFHLCLYKLSWIASIIALKMLLKNIFVLIASMIVAGDCVFSLFLCWLVARF